MTIAAAFDKFKLRFEGLIGIEMRFDERDRILFGMPLSSDPNSIESLKEYDILVYSLCF